MNDKKREFLKLFLKSAFVTLCAIMLIITGYFTAKFLLGGL